ncbi:hypothetical protein ACI792_20380 [Blastococcus sp. SYSU DS0669]
MLPWLIGAALLLVAGLGTLLVVLLGGDAERRSAELTGAGQEASAPSSVGSLGGTGPLPGGARLSAPVVADGGLYPGSGDVALAWVQAMAEGDFQTAYDLSCEDVQEAAAGVADGGDPALVLGDYFYSDTLSGHGFTGGTFDGVEHQPESATDLASFTLDLDDGEQFLLYVYVDADGTVCDFY